MPTVKIEIEVWCAECGKDLSMKTIADTVADNPRLVVEPCPICLERARLDGYDDGRADQEEKEATP